MAAFKGSKVLDEREPVPVLDVDSHVLARKFNQKPFGFTHRLNDHPAFELEHLAEVARQLKAKYFQSGDVAVGQDFRGAPRHAKSAHEAIERIHELSSWVILKRVDQLAEFRELRAQTMATVSRAAGRDYGRGASKLEAFVFVTSPGGVSPFHIDAEATFLFQIHGRKTCYVFDQNDRAVLTQEQIERFYRGDQDAAQYSAEHQDKALVFDLSPGQGVHLPVLAPHWLENGDDVSVTFTVSFIPPESAAVGRLHFANYLLRKCGMRPAEPGLSAARDRLKSVLGSAVSTLASMKRVLTERVGGGY